jgi:hypothetical protein
MRLTKTHLSNLSKLADFLETEVTDAQFDISWHLENNENVSINPKDVVPECGTVGCAVGWASSLFYDEALKFSCWFKFSQKMFGCAIERNFKNVAVARYMFDGGWDNADRTKFSTIRRIREVVKQKGKLTERQIDLMIQKDIITRQQI